MAYRSYTGGRNLYGQLTNDTSSGNLSNGDTYVDASVSDLIGKRAWPFLFRESTTTTVGSQQYVIIPRNYTKLTSVKVTQGTTVWTPNEVPNRRFWDQLNAQTASSYTSDIPEWFYPFNGRCYFWPTPATSGNTVTFFGKIGFRGLSIADYTTGTITTATSGSTNMVGSSSLWNDSMAGRYIRITEANGANKGDGEWYEISSVTSGTELVLSKPYLGTTIAAGTAAYTIGQMPPLPEEYGDAPIFRAVSIYYSSKTTTGASAKAKEFGAMYDTMAKQLESDYGSGTDNVILEGLDAADDTINPNLVVRL